MHNNHKTSGYCGEIYPDCLIKWACTAARKGLYCETVVEVLGETTATGTQPHGISKG